MKKFILLLLVFLVCLSSVSCMNNSINSDNINVDKTKNDTSNADKQITVDEIINKMTLEEKVWQMFFVRPEDIVDNISIAIQAGTATEEALKKYPVGGIIYFSQNIENREQLTQMIKTTQKYSEIPLFISIDEEGGRVSRLGNANVGVTLHPPMAQIGAGKNPEVAGDIGETLANELLELGFNMDFAPVADVITVENNEDIGDRSFGKDPEIVAQMVTAQVSGMQDNGLVSTLKHFPSNGSTAANTHEETGVCTRTLEQMRETEFIPFIAGIEAGADVVMIAHMTAVDIDNVPSTLSKVVVTDILRNELNFDGVVISDALNMGAITSVYSPEEVAVLAVNAGVDLLLMSPDVKAAANAILEKVNSGDISQERIDESVRRIISLKLKRNIIK